MKVMKKSGYFSTTASASPMPWMLMAHSGLIPGMITALLTPSGLSMAISSSGVA